MPQIPEPIIKENYLLRSTFFYNKLSAEGYFSLFSQLKRFTKLEGSKLDWSNRGDWHIGEDAWSTISNNGIPPSIIFLHPKVLRLYPTFLKYYRSIALIPQKGLKAISKVSNIDEIESGQVEASRISQSQIDRLVISINETLSTLISLATNISEQKIEGMMYATAGTKIDGSWRNSIGAEGERVIRTIIFNELLSHKDISSISDKNNNITAISKWKRNSNIDNIKTIHLINGYSILFSSEPDITFYDGKGAIVGVIEIKAGLDPAGALERLGAMLKSFENTLAEYPNAVTILVASCITDEVESRLSASMFVRQKYITTNISNNEHEKRKFVNRLRSILKLVK